MSVQHIISEALIEYDQVQPVIEYLLDNTYIEGQVTTNDMERSVFRFYDRKTQEFLLETEVELMAVFYDKYNIWSWSWGHIGIANSENYLCKEALLYALKLESDLAYIKSILTTSRGVVKDTAQIDINLAVCSSIIKQPYIYPFTHKLNNNNLIYYNILLNKKGLDELAAKIKSLNNKFIDS